MFPRQDSTPITLVALLGLVQPSKADLDPDDKPAQVPPKSMTMDGGMKEIPNTFQMDLSAGNTL